ncbi:Sugar transferase involved in LPS biosynthesis (colanic, teichoic acid) [Dyadobacter soli]|uniref:Sugar transferase involved in LPS biosynthesis (Colanic, teichoic acid) n=1 Tax=Dyadobacter soli TaxID=659014 RepID=A0A1G7ETU3_9BACT|nr:sugar transferase [Dyadobacter soli]SDE67069.1 Sugar transferase involved in LPS biosynthesis (colanic, teichoic acid) [Dyadobacter soli]
MYRSKGKRILDILLAATGLLTSLPLFIVLPPVLWVYFKGNPFFVQVRPGLNARLFAILKFRTMHGNGRPAAGFGKFLRRSSLDELPQFWNVLVGEMSIVGPRPLLAEYLPLYNVNQLSRHAVKPGMTGLAQINGRNALSWEEKFEYDLHYVENLSLALDLRIICATMVNALSFRQTAATEALPFKGNEVC